MWMYSLTAFLKENIAYEEEKPCLGEAEARKRKVESPKASILWLCPEQKFLASPPVSL